MQQPVDGWTWLSLCPSHTLSFFSHSYSGYFEFVPITHNGLWLFHSLHHLDLAKHVPIICCICCSLYPSHTNKSQFWLFSSGYLMPITILVNRFPAPIAPITGNRLTGSCNDQTVLTSPAIFFTEEKRKGWNMSERQAGRPADWWKMFGPVYCCRWSQATGLGRSGTGLEPTRLKLLASRRSGHTDRMARISTFLHFCICISLNVYS